MNSPGKSPRAGPALPRLAAAGITLPTAALGSVVPVQAQVATLFAALAALLAAEHRWFPAPAPSEGGST